MQNSDFVEIQEKAFSDQSGSQKNWFRRTIDDLTLSGAVGVICTFVSMLTFVLYSSFDRDIEAVGKLVTANAESISNLTSKIGSVDDRVIALQTNVTAGIIGSSAEVAEIKANYQTQHNELARLKDDVEKTENKTNIEIEKLEEKAAEDIDKVEKETNKNGESITAITDTVKIVSSVSTKVDSNENNIVSLNQGFTDTEKKISKIEVILKLGITNSEVREAMIRLVDGNPVQFESLSKLEELWKSKREVTAQEMESHLRDTYTSNPKDVLLIAYDDLAISRPLTFFLQKKEIRSMDREEPDLGASLPGETTEQELSTENTPDLNLIETYQALEEINLENEYMSIADVCQLLPRTPHTECYRMFLRNLGELQGVGIDRGKIVENAVVKALVRKYEIVQ